MRHFLMSYGLSAPKSTSEDEIDLLELSLINIAEANGFDIGGGLIEVDEHGRRIDGFKTDDERLAIFDQVNNCETLDKLAEVIRSLADEQGNIQGRTRVFPAEMMAYACENYGSEFVKTNTLTREYGIRQQAIYIKNKSSKR